jgi:transcriptional regulator
MKAPMTLLPGTLDILVLKAASWQTQHGYGLARSIEERSNDELKIEEGALYQALHRLERQGYLTATWGVSDNNRRAKFYALTQMGRRRLREDSARWHRYADAMGRVLAPA